MLILKVHCTCTLVLYCITFAGVKLLKEFQAEYANYEKQRQELTNAEKLFDLPITLYPGLVEVDKELKNIARVYDLYEAQRVRQPLLTVELHAIRVLYYCRLHVKSGQVRCGLIWT